MKTKLNLPLPLPLYRGIAAEGENAGKMIEGSALFSIIDGDEDISIITLDEESLAVTIRPETLSMYIGKEDMNGKNIFTGYVLKYEGELDGEKLDTEYIMPYWEQSICSFMLHSSQSDLPVDIDKYISECEIIGNIHENPELLKLFPHLHGGKQ